MALPECVLFFDIDNTLYSKSSRIGELMATYIRNYVRTRLNISTEEAERLHQHYYKEYGLAIEGLVRKNKIDAMDYNEKVDNKLPLEEILHPRPEINHMLHHIRRPDVRTWLLTNAYITHAERVTRVLGLSKEFEGVTYCNYTEPPLICKPMPEMFTKAMLEAGLDPSDHSKCYFVDDSDVNVKAAAALGWHAVLLDEENDPPAPGSIRSLLDLPVIWPELFQRRSSEERP